MLLQGILATIKHSYEKVRLIAVFSKGDNLLFLPMVIIMSHENSAMKDTLILRHKFTISVGFVSGQVCVSMTHSSYLALQQGQPVGQRLPEANWGCSFCVQGEERAWQRFTREPCDARALRSRCVLRHHHSFTREEPSWSFLLFVLNLEHLLFIPQSMSLALDLEICLPKRRFWLACASYLVSNCSS